MSDSPRIRARFAAGHKALIPYIPAGYPDPAATPELLDALQASGADVIELGIPFSDPLADGPTIQRASQRAIEAGASLSGALRTLHDFRARSDVPVVLFTYLNPVVRYGLDRFLGDAASAGADGVLLTDLPVDADPEIEQRVESSPLALIRLVAPTTSAARARHIAERAQGFLYYISRTGVTGASARMRDSLAGELQTVRSVSAAPVAVGFGISTPEHAAAAAAAADGVVVGSAVIDALDRGGARAMSDFVASLKQAI